MKWERVVQRLTQREGLGVWTNLAQGGTAQQWLQHRDAFAVSVCSSMGSNLADG